MCEVLAQRHIGDREVAAIGMGAMTLTQTLDHNPHRAIAVVEAALETGVTLFDTADCYGPTSEMGVNELALITALRSIPGALDIALVATKGGHTRGPNATWWIDGTPEHIASAARASLAPVPIPGASRPESIRDSALASQFTLDTAELRRLNEKLSGGQPE